MAKQKFLIADDDGDDTELLTEAFQAIDPAVVCEWVTDGEQVFNILQGTKNLPSVIFLDLNMPVMDGWDCLNDLKKHDQYKDIPVLIYSTSTLSIDVKRALELGAAGFITKPSSFKQIKILMEGVYSKVVNQKIHEISEVRGVIT